MRENLSIPDDPVAAVATAYGESALAVIRCSGKGTIENLSRLFSKQQKLMDSPGYRLIHGFIVEPESGNSVDEVMLAVYRSPKSYTGEDSVEIMCHGSSAGLKRIMELLLRNDFRMAERGEFSLRAFLNGKMDLSQAEAVNEIVGTKTRESHALALDRLEGSVRRKVEALRGDLVRLLSHLELYLDYPDEDSGGFEFPYELVDTCIACTEELASTFQIGKLYQQGVKVVIAGKTNVGKSSLFNLLLKEERSIVTDIHGTTRDYIESWITLKGIPVLLYDTAGLRVSAEPVESEGIRRSERVLADADLVLYIVDAELGITEEEKAEFLRRQNEENYLLVWNKTDLSPADVPEGFIPLSVKTGGGFFSLEEALYRRIAGEKLDTKAEVVIDSVRQRDLLIQAARSLRKVREEAEEGVPIDLLALELREASDALGQISGEVSSAEILDNLFSNFCLGK